MTVQSGFPATTLNGAAVPQQAAPQNWPAAASLQGPPARNTRPAPKARRKLDLHGTQFLIPLVYVGAVVIASFGGVEAASPKFGLAWYLTLPLWLFIEAVGVLMMAIAKKELVKGRKTLAAVAAVASAAIAGGVAWLNFTGHAGNPWVAWVFGGASIAAYGTFVLNTIDSALDAALLDLRREAKGFRYPLMERLRHPGRTRLATEIMARNPGTKPGDARLAAVDHPIMLAFIRQRLSQPDIGADGKPGPRRPAAEVDGIIHVLEPHTLVPMFREQMGPYRADLVKVMVAELGAKSLLGPATARQRIGPPRVDAATLTGAAKRGPAQAIGAGSPKPSGRRTTEESADLYRHLRAEHGPFDKATGTGWTQEQIAKAMGISPQRLRQIKSDATITDDD